MDYAVQTGAGEPEARAGNYGQYDLAADMVYDRITQEGQYFDYPNAAQTISELVPPQAHILELCVGTGNLASELARLGHQVTGIDFSDEMLASCRNKTTELPVSLIKGSAETFDLDDQFDAVVIHSGHIIINRASDGSLRLNGESEGSMSRTVSSIGPHVKPGGKLIMNIEEWDDKLVPYQDG
ncbi:MAG TPA: class I SAM-dependent methyltransferase [Candidatus Saccharimonadales bacterium]|nr:class I SAM-dependent methyltransferase [Candidatus Saccharimonadales bacterium]